MSATVPPSSSDGRSLGYRYVNIHTPLEVLASYNPNDSVDRPGYAGATGYYYGGVNYQGDDSGDSRVIPVLGRRHHSVQVTSTQTSAYSVQVEGSLDGITWSNLQTAFTADSLYNFDALIKFIRFHVTALTLSGGYDNTIAYGLNILYIGVAD